jgi:molybdopterin converting factor small subunit
MKRSILFFGQLRDIAGTPLIETELPARVSDIPALIEWLSAENENLGAALRRGGIRVALNKSFVAQHARLGHAEEIAFMSPLSGG